MISMMSCSHMLLLAAEGSYLDDLLIVLSVATIATLLCVGLHYEVIRMLIVMARRGVLRGHRSILIAVILVLLLAHLVEAVIYALSYQVFFAIQGNKVEHLTGPYSGSFADSLYFSLTVYTTVGFGDITPNGATRLLVGIEALVGLVLITWSASFTFLIMQRIFTQDFGIEEK